MTTLAELPETKRSATPEMLDLSRRCQLPELMDDPDLSPVLHDAALRGLRRINTFSRSISILWPHLRKAAKELDGRPLRVLDVACGGGDAAVGLACRAAKAGLAMQVDGCDISPHAIAFAREFAGLHNVASDCRFFIADAIRDGLPNDYDVVMCSLFLHHLTELDARRLLTRMAAACRSRVLVSDLRRTRFGYVLAVAGCRLLTRSPIVHIDGPLSVRAAWSEPEVMKLAAEAGMSEARMTQHWPQRFLLRWNKT